MLRKTLALVICLAMLVCSLGAFAEEVSPEDIIGKLQEAALEAAIANGDQIKFTVNAGIENAESLGEESGVVVALLSAMLYTGAVQVGEDASAVTYGFTLSGEELCSIDLSFIDSTIYASSDLWDGATYKLSLNDALNYAMTMIPEEYQEAFNAGTAIGNEFAALLLNAETWAPYLEAIQSWTSQNVTIYNTALTADEAAELAHAEAVTKQTFEITGLAVQGLVDNIINVLLTDDVLLGVIAEVAAQTGTPLTVDDLKAGIAQFQGMAGMFLGGMLKPIEYTTLYDARGNIVYYEVTGGVIISEEESADFDMIYDVTVVDGVTYVSVNYDITDGAGTLIAFDLSKVVEPIVTVGDTLTQNQKLTFGYSQVTDGTEVGSLSVSYDVAYETGAAKEVRVQTIEFTVSGETAEVLIDGEGVPFSGMKVSTVETTDVTETGFVTITDQKIEYLGTDGDLAGFPVITETIRMENAPGVEITASEDAIDVLGLTDEQWAELGTLLEQKLTELSEKLISLVPGLADLVINLDGVTTEVVVD
ncbi:hypothetical protein AGMMS49992_07180 [Clostridia bacterium]|nr:hypothetical protein AGMMS49992_07180 [Clostridia bacterium]